jgi:hypothetical protein
MYDRARTSRISTQSGPETFDKFVALMDLVLESDDVAKDLRFSARQHLAFAVFLKNLLRYERRLVPSPDVLFYVAQSCFNRAFAERLHGFLSGYYEQIAVERIRPVSTAEQGVMLKYKLDVDSTAAGYVSRVCYPTPPRYKDTRVKQKSQQGRSAHDVAYHWLPEEHFLYRMHQRIRKAIASQDRQRQCSREYRGSVEMGIDIRATLRAALSKRPRVYVKANAQIKRPIEVRNEPIVWILDKDFNGQGCFSAAGIERKNDAKWNLGSSDSNAFPIGTIEVYQPWESSEFNDIYNVLTYNKDQTGRILYARRCGWINFGWDFENEEDAKTALGDAFDRRFPNHKNYHDSRDEGRMLGCIDPEFRDLQSEGGPWSEIALMTALKYAESGIVVAAPAGFAVPSRAAAYSVRLGKAIHVTMTDFLSRSDLEKFRSHYLYHTPGGRDLAGETNFEILMRGFWE